MRINFQFDKVLRIGDCIIIQLDIFMVLSK